MSAVPRAVNEPTVALCCQISAPSEGGGTLRPWESSHTSTVSPCRVAAGTRAVALFSVPSGAVQCTAARYDCCPPRCSVAREPGVRSTTVARTWCRSARCCATTAWACP